MPLHRDEMVCQDQRDHPGTMELRVLMEMSALPALMVPQYVCASCKAALTVDFFFCNWMLTFFKKMYFRVTQVRRDHLVLKELP